MNPPVVSMRDVAVSRGGRTIWSNATLDIPQGSFSAVIGPNGSGKSTFVAMVLGLLKPSHGQLQVFGKDPEVGNRNIGLVPQNHTLDNASAVLCRDLVGLGVMGTRWGLGVRNKAIAGAVDEALAAVDATDYADQRYGSVSGGQQQRISIAQALITRPKLLILDEPLAGLDLLGQVDIVELVHRINHDRGVTVLFVTHDLNPLLAHIDSVLYVLDGRPQFGPTDEVVDSRLLTRLYGTSVQVTRAADGCIFTRTE
ncbi:MAG: ABC transporter ATP-binding protein [Actinomycetes bacterium]